MKKLMPILLVSTLCVGTLLFASSAFAVEVAPRISDKEIIEGLADIRGDIKKLEAKVEGDIKELRAEIKRLEEGQKVLHQQINDLKVSTQQQINDMKTSTQQQINDLRELIKWMLGILISISFTVMVIMGRILWNQQKKLTQIETSLEAQKEEISFLKTLIEKLQILIEKLLPPKGVL